MEPRIEYQNPLGPTGADRIASTDRASGEREGRGQNGSGRRAKRNRQADTEEPPPSDEAEGRGREDLGKRIDLEA
jgi:hypothetical protein